MLPDCYDPVRQEEDRQTQEDRFVEDLPVCSCCGRSVYPGDVYYEHRSIIVCSGCKIELEENERILDK